MTNTKLETKSRQAREATVRAHANADNRHDPDATVATFSNSKASYDIPAFGDAGQVPNHNAICELFVECSPCFLTSISKPGPLRHGDDHVFVELFLPGTQNADWVGIPSTGRSFSTRVALLFEFEQDQLVCERCYMDFGDIARQLRATN